MKWTLQTRKIEEIYLNEKNPRKISKYQAKELGISLQKFGLCQPIVINTTGKVLGGHQRVKLMHSLGYATIDVYVPSNPLTEEEEEELSIRLNKNVGSFDFDLLANHWDCEMLLSSGFSMDELQLESVPDQKTPPTKFTITIMCTNQDQLEIIEQYIAPLVQEYIGASYKVRIK